MVPRIVQFTALDDANPAKGILDKLDFRGTIQVEPCGHRSELDIRAALSGASGLICRPNDGIEFTPSHLERAARPFVAGTFSAGADHLRQIKGLAGVTIVKSDGGNAAGVAELTLAHAMTLTRRLYNAERSMESGFYEAQPSTRVEGKHWLAVGAGEQVAHLIAKSVSLGIGSFTIYHDQQNEARVANCLRLIPNELISASTETPIRVKTSARSWMTITGTQLLNEAIPVADIISLHVPATRPDPGSGRPSTEGMVNHEFLRLTKTGCCLINVARGSLVNEHAVVEWLRSRPDCGFAADVLDQRAERERDPSLSLLHQEFMKSQTVRDPSRRANLVLTPHIGGSAKEDFYRVCEEVLDRVIATMRISKHLVSGRSI